MALHTSSHTAIASSAPPAAYSATELALNDCTRAFVCIAMSCESVGKSCPRAWYARAVNVPPSASDSAEAPSATQPAGRFHASGRDVTTSGSAHAATADAPNGSENVRLNVSCAAPRLAARAVSCATCTTSTSGSTSSCAASARCR